MGIAPSKKDIKKILENSITNRNISEQNNFKIEYKFNYNEYSSVEENSSSTMNQKNNCEKEDNESFIFSQEITQVLNNPKLDVKRIKKFPYCGIGTISVQFPIGNEIFKYTCFLIDANVVVTLASNLENKNLGGKAISIMTSFSKENVKWENIFIQGEEKSKSNNSKNENNKKESLDYLSSRLAVILYDDNIGNEWLGVEEGKKDDFEGRDTFVVFSFNEGRNNINKLNKGEVEINDGKYREIFISNINPFLDASKKGEEKDIKLIKQSPGSPLYYRDYNNGAYVIAIINENFEFQYIDKKTMVFLANMVNKGKLLRKKVNKGIDEENIVQLDLQRHDFGPLDIKYITDFNLKNLRILDLSSNSIKPQGAFYLSQSKFISLESLNLNFNEIGDEGLNHIANGCFTKLNCLYLFHDNITS